MSRLSDAEREWVGLMLEDALIPYGRDFDPRDAARLIEARLERMLDRRAAATLRSQRDFFLAVDMDAAADHCEQAAISHDWERGKCAPHGRNDCACGRRV